MGKWQLSLSKDPYNKPSKLRPAYRHCTTGWVFFSKEYIKRGCSLCHAPKPKYVKDFYEKHMES